MLSFIYIILINKYFFMAKIKMEMGTFAHAFRTEMSQVIHWSLVVATSAIIGLQLLSVDASYVAEFLK